MRFSWDWRRVAPTKEALEVRVLRDVFIVYMTIREAQNNCLTARTIKKLQSHSLSLYRLMEAIDHSKAITT